jgi:hypothetical protein
VKRTAPQHSIKPTAVHTPPDRLSLLFVVPDNAVIPIVGARRSQSLPTKRRSERRRSFVDCSWMWLVLAWPVDGRTLERRPFLAPHLAEPRYSRRARVRASIRSRRARAERKCSAPEVLCAGDRRRDQRCEHFDRRSVIRLMRMASPRAREHTTSPSGATPVCRRRPPVMAITKCRIWVTPRTGSQCHPTLRL